MDDSGQFHRVNDQDIALDEFGTPRPDINLVAIFRINEEFPLRGFLFKVSQVGRRGMRILPKLDDSQKAVRVPTENEEISSLKEEVVRLKKRLAAMQKEGEG